MAVQDDVYEMLEQLNTGVGDSAYLEAQVILLILRGLKMIRLLILHVIANRK
jgi:hypothetical protein